MSLLRNLGWWVSDYTYAVGWQAHAAMDRTDSHQFESGSLRPVVLIPGVYEPWQFLRPVIDALHQAGHPVHLVPELGTNRESISESARIIERILDVRDLRDVVIVAHSKGGLIGKQVMVGETDGPPRVARMVAICTPFQGSSYAKFLPIRTLQIFSPDDPDGVALRDQRGVNSRIVSIYGPFDPHIPEGSALGGAINRQVETGGHFRLLSEPAVLSMVLEEAR